MRVIRARSAGLCLGVSLALKCLDKELNLRGQGRLITLGPIIHNPLLMRRYADAGVFCDVSPQDLAPEDRLVIRAHGVPRTLEESLRQSGAHVVDATCPKVKKAQLAIARAHARGRTLLLFGEKEHPEVSGLLSYAGPDAFVFGELEELRNFDLDAKRDYCLAAQTTQEEEIFRQALDYLEERLGPRIEALDTICDATKARQSEVLELCDKVEAMIVVGGFNSGNTRRLAEVARSVGLFVLHVEQPSDFDPDARQRLRALRGPVGISAGASTPTMQIEAVQYFLEGLLGGSPC
ncbi:MAG: 4-hydroxy-3-methylbut-2-enyl diphosphate reductase [Desulfovibrio sp.]|jgi:4-hydroxy-3-methylbut-2-enyl diphosphate reductase|nr:4-hydroxy-3-methylbut-2-enyl diphosphate reductase [Desulfovibrio sp.]